VNGASVRADLRALAAAGLKSWRTSRRYPTNLVGLVIWPVILPLAYVLQADALAGGSAAAASAFASRTGTADVASFLFLGWAVYMWLSIILWGPGTALRTEQIRGSLEAQLVSPASRVVILFGPVVEGMVWVLLVFGVVLLTLTLGFGLSIGPLQVAGAVGVVVIGLPALYGLGALFAAVVLRFGEVHAPVQLVRGLFTAACGMTFPLAVLPGPAQALAAWLPPTYLIADVREVLLGGGAVHGLAMDLAIQIAMGVMLCALAIVAFRATERHARRGGSLAQY
jgi:ABC-2 type transport system permease protein